MTRSGIRSVAKRANGTTVFGGTSAERKAKEGKGQVLVTNHNLDLVFGKETRL